MNAILNRFQPYISLKPFLMGLGAVAFIYLGLFIFVFLQSGKTISKFEEKLASESVRIERVEAERGVGGLDVPEVAGHSTVEHHSETIIDHTKDSAALFPAPLAGLYEDNGRGGKLPIISDQNLSPFKAYKKEFFSDLKPMIAVVVMDFGLSDAASDMVLKSLPSEVSLILSPYSDHADDWQKSARAAGHEIWLQIPTETQNMPEEDPGPQALLSGASLKYNQERIDWLLTRTTGYAGVAAYSDTSLSNGGSMISNIFKNVFSRGVGYMELNPDAPPLIETLSLSNKVPYARNQLFVENTSLKNLEKMAKQYGYVVALVRPYPKSIDYIKTWMRTLPQKGFVVAPVSAVAEFNR